MTISQSSSCNFSLSSLFKRLKDRETERDEETFTSNFLSIGVDQRNVSYVAIFSIKKKKKKTEKKWATSENDGARTVSSRSKVGRTKTRGTQV